MAEADTYPYQRYFPRPFRTNGVHILAGNSRPLMWMATSIDDNFKNTVIARLNGEDVVMDGTYVIGHDLEEVKSNHDNSTAMGASAWNNKIYHIDETTGRTHCILMARGWGYLTGTCTCDLHPSDAGKIQDGFLEWVCATLNKRA